jgi:hypothetical protein
MVAYLFLFCFLIFGGDLVYSSIVLAPLCGDVHKGRVYTCGLFEEGWIPDPGPCPCKVCFLNLEMEEMEKGLLPFTANGINDDLGCLFLWIYHVASPLGSYGLHHYTSARLVLLGPVWFMVTKV